MEKKDKKDKKDKSDQHQSWGSGANKNGQSTMSSIRGISRSNEPSCKRSFVKTNFQVFTTNVNCKEMNILVFCS